MKIEFMSTHLESNLDFLKLSHVFLEQNGLVQAMRQEVVEQMDGKLWPWFFIGLDKANAFGLSFGQGSPKFSRFFELPFLQIPINPD